MKTSITELRRSWLAGPSAAWKRVWKTARSRYSSRVRLNRNLPRRFSESALCDSWRGARDAVGFVLFWRVADAVVVKDGWFGGLCAAAGGPGRAVSVVNSAKAVPMVGLGVIVTAGCDWVSFMMVSLGGLGGLRLRALVDFGCVAAFAFILLQQQCIGTVMHPIQPQAVLPM